LACVQRAQGPGGIRYSQSSYVIAAPPSYFVYIATISMKISQSHCWGPFTDVELEPKTLNPPSHYGFFIPPHNCSTTDHVLGYLHQKEFHCAISSPPPVLLLGRQLQEPILRQAVLDSKAMFVRLSTANENIFGKQSALSTRALK